MDLQDVTRAQMHNQQDVLCGTISADLKRAAGAARIDGKYLSQTRVQSSGPASLTEHVRHSC